MRYAISLAMAVCMLAPAVAQEKIPVRFVTIHTHPAGATVTLRNQTLGKTGVPIAVPLAEGNPALTFVLQLDGYSRYDFTIQQSQLLNQHTDLPIGKGTIYLHPESPMAVLTTYRLPILGFLVLALAGLAATMAMLRKQRRVMQFEAMLARAESGIMEGRVLGGYELRSLLGAGGMARVYRGQPQSRRGEPAAVKVIEPEAEADPEIHKRFLREVKLCKEMDHPHIVRIYDWGEQDGFTYLAMELVEGGTLRARLQPGEGLAPGQVREIVLPLFQAVAYAHGRGVVHRDLKPENVMFTRGGKLKVMDFGLSRGTNSTNLTQAGTVVGTPAYMAPEQVQGTSYAPAIDQYALGVIAYELVTGCQPFTAPDPVQVLFMHVAENPPPLKRHREDVFPEVDQVVLKMLAKAPEARFASVEEAGAYLVAALDKWAR